MANVLLTENFTNNIKLNLKSVSKEEAIIQAGKLLTSLHYVKPGYEQSMLNREKEFSTYIGSHVAIPHGTDDSIKDILQSGICILQFPDGIDYDGHVVFFLIGIACKTEDTLEELLQITDLIINPEKSDQLIFVKNKKDLIQLVNENYQNEGEI
ncbi:MAG: PTS sugar transporter subunit IIA [Anaerostipes sp.]|nr:PTS sugar transporter subunit IIA [Anaerostipes sp.]MDD3745855.1 PTS sugar transporter subunit IIA [Anaerostipes sp.]